MGATPPSAIIHSPVPAPILVPDSPLDAGLPGGAASPHLADAVVGAACVAFLDPVQRLQERPRLGFVEAAADASAQASVVARAAQALLRAAVLPAGPPRLVPLR